MHLSSVTARLVGLAGILALPLFVGALFSTVHYQNRVSELRQEIFEETQFIEQKDLIATRIAWLERNLSRTQSNLAGLQDTLDTTLGQIKSGLGPIESEPELQIMDTAFHDEKATMLEPLLENSDTLTLKDARYQVNVLEEKLKGLEVQVEKVASLNQDRIEFFKAMPNVIPVDGWITSDFGFRRSPYSGVYKMHYGIDIAAPVGTAILAPSDGRVVLAEYNGGYGRKIILDHGYGITTSYSHASELFVQDGDVIKRGQTIAAVGSSGASTGPHLHYEVHVDGIPADPLPYVIE